MLSKRSSLHPVALVLLAAATCGSLRAAELGEVKVNSYLGQQLSADIELVDLTAADLAELRAKLASPDVFKGAGLEMRPEFAGLYISIARRDNKRFLHLTTLQPVNADALHLFLELNSGGRQSIRAASLWLAPEPPAQRAPQPAATPAAASPLPAPAATAASPSPAENGEAGLSEAARRAFAYRKQKEAQAGNQPMPPAAPVAAPKSEPDHRAAAQPARQKAPAKADGGSAVPPVARSSKPAPAPAPSCAPEEQVQAELRQCQAMTNKLVDIEGKVRGLQKALVAPATAMPAGAAAPKPEPAPVKPAPAPAKPASSPSKPAATPVKPGVAADLAGNPRRKLVMLIAGALAGLAALGATIYFLRKRQAKGPLKIWQSFRKKDDDVPILEEVEEVAAQ